MARSVQRNFRLTPEEDEKLHLLCDALGIPVSEWIRQTLRVTDIQKELQKHIDFMQERIRKLKK